MNLIENISSKVSQSDYYNILICIRDIVMYFYKLQLWIYPVSPIFNFLTQNRPFLIVCNIFLTFVWSDLKLFDINYVVNFNIEINIIIVIIKLLKYKYVLDTRMMSGWLITNKVQNGEKYWPTPFRNTHQP